MQTASGACRGLMTGRIAVRHLGGARPEPAGDRLLGAANGGWRVMPSRGSPRR